MTQPYEEFVEEVTRGSPRYQRKSLLSFFSDLIDPEPNINIPFNHREINAVIEEYQPTGGSVLNDNPTIILLNESSDKFKAAIAEFSEMFPHLDQAEISATLQRNDGNSEQTLNELLCA